MLNTKAKSACARIAEVPGWHRVTKTFGPFRLYHYKNRKEHKHFVDISLKGFDEFGWEWGSDGMQDDIRLALVIFGLKVFWFERWRNGFHVAFIGFWWVR